MNTNFQTIHQMGNAVSEMVRQATGRNSVQSMDMDWVTVEQTKKWIYGEDSGDIVSFVTNLRNGITKLNAMITPVQDMHGYDHPWPGGGGKNLLKYPYTSTTKTENGITFTDNGDGTVTINGTSTERTDFTIIGTSTGGLPIANGTYKLTAWIVSGTISDSSSIAFYIHAKPNNSDASYDNFPPSTEGTTHTETVTDGVFYHLTLRCNTADVTYTNFKIRLMLCVSTETDLTWEPYTNICPIYGWNMCNVFVTGKNLLNPDDFRKGYYVNTSGVLEEFQYASISGYIPAKSWSVYRFSGYARSTTGGYRSVTAYDSEGNFIKQWRYSELVSADTEYEIVVRITDPNIKILLVNFQNVDYDIQVAISSSNISYEEFTGNTYTAIWSDEDPGIVYMGSVDTITGILTVNALLVTYDGSEDENWQIQGDTYKYGTIHVSDLDYDKRENSISDTFVYASIGNSNSNIGFGFVSTNDLRIRKALDTSLTASDFKQYLSLNPVKILYPIKIPVTYQLDPITVESIVGTNYVMADTGTVSVEYRHEEEMP